MGRVSLHAGVAEPSCSSAHAFEQAVRSVVLKELLPELNLHFKRKSSLCKLSYELSMDPSWDKAAIEDALCEYEPSPGAVIKRVEWKEPGCVIIILKSGPGHSLTESAHNAMMFKSVISIINIHVALGEQNGPAEGNGRSFVGDGNSHFVFNAEGKRETWFVTEVVSHQNKTRADEKIQDALNTTTLKAVNRIDIGEAEVDNAQMFTFRRSLFVKGSNSNRDDRGPLPVDLGAAYHLEEQVTVEEARSCREWHRKALAAEPGREIELPLERLQNRGGLIPKRFLCATVDQGDVRLDYGFVIAYIFSGLYEEYEPREAAAKAFAAEREDEDRRLEGGLPMPTPKAQRQKEKRDTDYSPEQKRLGRTMARDGSPRKLCTRGGRGEDEKTVHSTLL